MPLIKLKYLKYENKVKELDKHNTIKLSQKNN